MEYSSAWLCFSKAEDEYFTSQQAFMQNEAAMVSDLTKALIRAGHNQTALRLLVEMQPRVDIIATLLPGIMDLAIDSSNLNSIELARAVLYHYKNESWIRTISRLLQRLI